MPLEVRFHLEDRRARERNRLSCSLSRAESQHDLLLAVRVLLSPEFQQQEIHLRKNHPRPLHVGMAPRTQRDHQFQPGDARDAMMHGDLAFPSTRSAAPSAAVAVAREDRFAQAAESMLRPAVSSCSNSRTIPAQVSPTPARTAKRVLGSSLPHRYSFDLSRDSLSRMNASISDAFPKIRSHCSL
jgi:hypothetical protein